MIFFKTLLLLIVPPLNYNVKLKHIPFCGPTMKLLQTIVEVCNHGHTHGNSHARAVKNISTFRKFAYAWEKANLFAIFTHFAHWLTRHTWVEILVFQRPLISYRVTDILPSLHMPSNKNLETCQGIARGS